MIDRRKVASQRGRRTGIFGLGILGRWGLLDPIRSKSAQPTKIGVKRMVERYGLDPELALEIYNILRWNQGIWLKPFEIAKKLGLRKRVGVEAPVVRVLDAMVATFPDYIEKQTKYSHSGLIVTWHLYRLKDTEVEEVEAKEGLPHIY